ncbi:centromere/kinetochore protein zw10 homolog isoform X1 [Dendrobium catenatum]|uniref:centromere/kinetochore protein zw10 homolog isoform X1 n=1 Tax=Dendrobium catenatum TaxID=906689 RepID=UPI0009F5660D|nr:centromere/kinetochore protein zw10 homolog isoform X1 [Dendrobium catenatum]
MDVLGSMDVRELLSSEDLDETSPLSAPDLSLLIDRLQIRSLHIKSKVREYVLSHHREFADIFSRSAACAAGADEAAAALAEVLRLLSDHPVDREIRDLVKEIGRKRRELEQQRAALGFVGTISSLLERLKFAREDVRAGRLVEAAVAVRDLNMGLGVSEKWDENRGVEEPAVFGFLRKECLECFDELQCVLSRSMESLVQFEPENGTVTVRSTFRSGKTIELVLRRVLEAMEVVDVLDYGLAKVTDFMMKHAIGPAITNKGIRIWEEPNRDSAAMLRINLSSEHHGETEVVAIFSSLIQIIKFIYKFVCFENGIWMQCFGRLVWPRMSELIISQCLSKAVQEDATKMVELENIIRSTSEFENSLKEMNFISFSNKSEERLSHFIHNVEVHFASKKKNEILAKARKILLQFCSLEATSKSGMLFDDAYEVTSVHAADLLFQPEKCFVSSALCQVIQLVHETLKDACLSSARVAKELYHASRDVLLLYKAIIPMKVFRQTTRLAKQLHNVSQQAVIVHNDCYYLSQEIPGLTFEYRADFPSCLKKFIVFVDIAPSFYQMAENILQEQIQLVVSKLKEALDGADGFQNTHQQQQFELATFSINQVVFILGKVRVIWEPLMAASTYKRSMCIILDSFFSRITKDLLLLDDMAAEETLQLQRLIHMALEKLSPLFQSLIPEISEKDKLIKEISPSLLDELLPSLSKLRRLAGVLSSADFHPLKALILIESSQTLYISCQTCLICR